MNQREVWDNIADDWSKKRVNPVTDTIEFLRNKKGLILDLGCGAGRNLIATEGNIIAADFSYRQISIARNKTNKEQLDIDLIVSDALDLPFKDNSFDAIAVSNAFHCIKWNRRNAALKEIIRIAKDGASVFISVWNRDQPRFAGAKKESYIGWNVNGKRYERYYYLYSKDEFEALLKKHFKNVKVLGSREKAFGKYSKNIIATAVVKK
ncbi:MAG TPA: class I SAM-dependent methyltransferase [archaeon]|nr:class I SAM-dependent methyltransferase [archaeon]